MHRVGEVLDERAQLLVEVHDRERRGPQHRVAEQADRLDGHGGLLSGRRAGCPFYSACAHRPARGAEVSRGRPGRCAPGRRRPPCARSGRPGRRPAPGPGLSPSVRSTRTSARTRPPTGAVAGPGRPRPADGSSGCGPSTSAPAGSTAASSSSATPGAGPVTSARQVTGGKPSSRRSASSRSAAPDGSHRTRAWTARCPASAIDDDPAPVGPGRTRAAAASQRRSASSPARRSARSSSAQPSSSSAARVAALGDRLGTRGRHHERRLRRVPRRGPRRAPTCGPAPPGRRGPAPRPCARRPRPAPAAECRRRSGR